MCTYQGDEEEEEEEEEEDEDEDEDEDEGVCAVAERVYNLHLSQPWPSVMVEAPLELCFGAGLGIAVVWAIRYQKQNCLPRGDLRSRATSRVSDWTDPIAD